MTQFVSRITETNLNIFKCSKRSEVPKAPRLARFINLSCALIAQRGKNLSCEYFYRSLGCLQLTSSSFDVRVLFRVARQRSFKCECKCCAQSCFIQSAFHFSFLPLKPCVSLKSVPLNLCYTEAYHSRIA